VGLGSCWVWLVQFNSVRLLEWVRVGSDIGSSNVESFQISGRIRSGRVGYRII
jgi:hypothetical protein